MKKMIIALCVVLVVLLGGLVVIQSSGQTSSTFYDDAPHAVIGDTIPAEGTNLYYYYQETCVHCNNIKSSMADWYNNSKPEDVNFYLVDAATEENQEVWTTDSDNYTEPNGKVSELSDLTIQGTPTLIEVTDGEVANFNVGETDIPAYLDGLA